MKAPTASAIAPTNNGTIAIAANLEVKSVVVLIIIELVFMIIMIIPSIFAAP
jgi:hypothetical protein